MALILRALCKNAVPLTRSMAWFNRRPTADERSRKYREKHRKQDGDNTEDDGKPKKKYGQEVWENQEKMYKLLYPNDPNPDKTKALKVMHTDLFEDEEEYRNVRETWRKDMKPLALDYIKFDPETNEYRIEHIQSREHFEKKKIICVGIVGAFVPECTEDVVWEWARCSYSFTKGQKFNEVIIVSVNDAYVMQQFAQKVDLKDRISYIADWSGNFTEMMEATIDFENPGCGMGIKGQRYVSPVVNNRVKAIYQSVHGDKLAYTSSIHPNYLWKVLKHKKVRPRIIF